MRLFLFVLVLLFPLAAFAQTDLAAPTTMEWLKSNGQALLATVGALVVLAGMIAKLTPTNKDDEIVGVFERILNYWAPGGLHSGLTKKPPAE